MAQNVQNPSSNERKQLGQDKPHKIQYINQKIYKHYSLIKPQGCGINKHIERQLIENVVRINFLERQPKLIDNQKLNDLNQTFYTNRTWLNKCHENPDQQNKQQSFALAELNEFRKNKKLQLNELIEKFSTRVKESYNKETESIIDEVIEEQKRRDLLQQISIQNKVELIKLKRNKEAELNNQSTIDNILLQRNTLDISQVQYGVRTPLQAQKLQIPQNSNLNSTQLINTSKPVKMIKLRDHSLQKKLQNQTYQNFSPPIQRIYSKSNRASPELKKAEKLLENCTFYRKDINKSSNEIKEFQKQLNNRVTCLIKKMTKQKKDHQQIMKADILNMESSNLVHSYLVQQANEARNLNLNQRQSPEEQLMNKYEQKLLCPTRYNKLLFDQRKKQFQKDSQSIKMHRFIEDKNLGRILRIEDFLGFT